MEGEGMMEVQNFVHWEIVAVKEISLRFKFTYGSYTAIYLLPHSAIWFYYYSY